MQVLQSEVDAMRSKDQDRDDELNKARREANSKNASVDELNAKILK